MLVMQVSALGLTDPPPLEGRPGKVTHLAPDVIELFVVNGGMESGEPSVMFNIETGLGRTVIETSLWALVTGTYAAMDIAELRFGWTPPER